MILCHIVCELFFYKLEKEEPIGDDLKEPRILNHTVGIMGNINIQDESNSTVQPLLVDGARLMEFHNVGFPQGVNAHMSQNNTVISNEGNSSENVTPLSMKKENDNLPTFQSKENASAYCTEAQTTTTFTQSGAGFF